MKFPFPFLLNRASLLLPIIAITALIVSAMCCTPPAEAAKVANHIHQYTVASVDPLNLDGTGEQLPIPKSEDCGCLSGSVPCQCIQSGGQCRCQRVTAVKVVATPLAATASPLVPRPDPRFSPQLFQPAANSTAPLTFSVKQTACGSYAAVSNCTDCKGRRFIQYTADRDGRKLKRHAKQGIRLGLE